MPLWLDDVVYHLGLALRAVGVGLAAVTWVSFLTLHVQSPTNTRAYFMLAATLIGVFVVQLLGGLPPSVTVVDLLQPLERDVLAVAREKARGDSEAVHFLAARIATHAAVAVRNGNGVPKDRRAWFRTIAQSAVDDRDVDDRRDGRAAS